LPISDLEFRFLVPDIWIQFSGSGFQIRYPEPDPPDVALNYPDLDPVEKTTSGTPLSDDIVSVVMAAAI